MDTADLISQLEQLDDNMDDLEEALEPILGQSLSKLSQNLPLMDKAKLHALITYTLDSLLFSYLRLQGVDAKQHPVFREIKRVQQYFEKIKALETEPEQRTITLDKEAAGRFIKHGLAGNDKIDLELAEKQAREKAKAQLKAALLAKKAAAQKQGSPAQPQDPSSAAPSSAQSDDESDDDMKDESELATQGSDSAKEKTKSKKRKGKERRHLPLSKDAKAAKRMRKLDESERKEAKKERRQKKEEIRKARKAH